MDKVVVDNRRMRNELEKIKALACSDLPGAIAGIKLAADRGLSPTIHTDYSTADILHENF